MKPLSCIIALMLAYTYSFAQPHIVWHKSFGGSKGDVFPDIKKTADGGYILAGYAESFDGDLQNTLPKGIDFWVVKLDAAKSLQWMRRLGGTKNDEGISVAVLANNGGYIIGGTTSSSDGDVSVNHGNMDIWLVRLDMAGNIVWEKSYGGSDMDRMVGMVDSRDGIIFVADIISKDGDVGNHSGLRDSWLVKVSYTGAIMWKKAIAGTQGASPMCIDVTTDNGCVIGIASQSNDGDIGANYGKDDAWVFRFDATGTLLWKKKYGGSNIDVPGTIRQTVDDGYIFVGASKSVDYDLSGMGTSTKTNMWIVKLDMNGNKMWSKRQFVDSGAGATDVRELKNGNYVIAGSSLSLATLRNACLLSIDDSGNFLWQKSYGSASGNDFAYSILVENDSTFITPCHVEGGDGDVTNGNYHGYVDGWMVQLEWSAANVAHIPVIKGVKLYPTPTNGLVYIELPQEYTAATLSLTDMAGRTVMPESIGTGAIRQLNMEHLPAGTYTLTVTGENAKGVYKIVHQP